MRINAERVKILRVERQWSQEQLASACGVNPRTIQRIESRGTGSLESLRALASVFNMDPKDLIVREEPSQDHPFEAVKACFLRYADFTGTSGRFEYWWFCLFALLVMAMAEVIDDKLGSVVSLALLLPLLAAGSRRLHDTGRSGWWQLFFIAPFGFVVTFWLLAMPGKSGSPELEPA